METIKMTKITYSRYSREAIRATARVITVGDIIEFPGIRIKNRINEANSRFTNINTLLVDQGDKTTYDRRRARRSII
jgi:hypothetical protein